MKKFFLFSVLSFISVVVFPPVLYACIGTPVAVIKVDGYTIQDGVVSVTSFSNITFNGEDSYDGEGGYDTDMDSYAWDFGDGNTGTTKQHTHSYAASGFYKVTLTVTNGGGEDSDSIYVRPTGAVTIEVTGDCATIQEAIDLCNNDDTVLVSEGTYNENIDFKDKDIVVKSEFVDDPSKAMPVIDGDDKDSVVTFSGGEPASCELSGFKITDGWVAELTETPVAHWKLDDGSDTTADDSAGSNNGTLTGFDTPSWITSGRIGGALEFNGDDEYVNIDESAFENLEEGTVSAWVKPASSASTASVVCLSNTEGPDHARLVYLNGVNKPHCVGWYVKVNGIAELWAYTSANTVPADMWTHVAVTVDSSGNSIYVNGEQESLTYATGNESSAFFFDDLLNTNLLSIGCRDITTTTWDNYFEGKIDDVRIYSEALTAAKINQLYMGRVGGGIQGHNTSATISNCVIEGNTADYGGGIYGFGGDITNCLIADNTAIEDGGGLHSCDGDITNCTITENVVTTGSGGGLKDCDATIANTIIWNNDGTAYTDQIKDGSPTINYNCIQGWTTGGTNNTAGDPCFVDASSGDYHLKDDSASSCVDTGTATGAPTMDIDGNARPADGDNDGTATMDRGAYELPCIWYVDGGATGDNDGSNWTDAYQKLQDVLTDSVGVNDALAAGHEIWVADGTYYPDDGANQTTGDQSVSFQLVDDVAIYGGFEGKSATVPETARDQRDPATNVTILSGDIDTGGSNDSYIVVTGANNTVIDGFTIKDAVINGSTEGYGVSCGSTSTVIKNCLIRTNVCGVELASSSSVVTNCTIVDNSAYGIDSSVANQNITNCIIWNDGADDLSDCSAIYSCIQDGDIGTGNMSWPPYFKDTSTDDYHLETWSKCIDAGDPDSDYSQEPSGGGGIINMGVYGNTSGAATKSADAESGGGDGLPDDWETTYLGGTGNGPTDDTEPGISPDGISNEIEYLFGYNPGTDDSGKPLEIMNVSLSTSQIDPLAGETVDLAYYLNKSESSIKVRFIPAGGSTPVNSNIVFSSVVAGQNTHQDIWDCTTDNSGGDVVGRDFYNIEILKSDDTQLYISESAGQTAPQSVSQGYVDTNFDPYKNLPVTITSEVSDWCTQAIEVFRFGDSSKVIYTAYDDLLGPGTHTFDWYGYWDNGTNDNDLCGLTYDVDPPAPTGANKGPLLVYYGQCLSNIRCNPSRIIASNNEIVTITYDLAYDANVTVKLYDPDGIPFRTLDNGSQTKTPASNPQSVTWDGKDAAGTSGKYISKEGAYRLEISVSNPNEKMEGTISAYK